MTIITSGLLWFILIQLVNVFISTIKSILTVSGSRWTAAWVNAISYTFGAVVMKMITQQPFEVIIGVTMLSNLIGVYFAKWCLDKAKPVKLWTVTATLKSQNKDHIEYELKKRGMKYTLISAENHRYQLTIFLYSKGESSLLKEILLNHHIKFTITENRSGF